MVAINNRMLITEWIFPIESFHCKLYFRLTRGFIAWKSNIQDKTTTIIIQLKQNTQTQFICRLSHQSFLHMMMSTKTSPSSGQLTSLWCLFSDSSRQPLTCLTCRNRTTNSWDWHCFIWDPEATACWPEHNVYNTVNKYLCRCSNHQSESDQRDHIIVCHKRSITQVKYRKKSFLSSLLLTALLLFFLTLNFTFTALTCCEHTVSSCRSLARWLKLPNYPLKARNTISFVILEHIAPMDCLWIVLDCKMLTDWCFSLFQVCFLGIQCVCQSQ